MNLNASGTLLAQYTAVDALANTAYTAPDHLQIEITRIIVCNTAAGTPAVSIFHDDVGAGYSAANALLFGKVTAANDFLDIQTQGPNGGIHVKKGGTIGFTDSSSGDLTISIYGIAQQAVGGRI